MYENGKQFDFYFGVGKIKRIKSLALSFYLSPVWFLMFLLVGSHVLHEGWCLGLLSLSMCPFPKYEKSFFEENNCIFVSPNYEKKSILIPDDCSWSNWRKFRIGSRRAVLISHMISTAVWRPLLRHLQGSWGLVTIPDVKCRGFGIKRTKMAHEFGLSRLSTSCKLICSWTDVSLNFSLCYEFQVMRELHRPYRASDIKTFDMTQGKAGKQE